MSQAAEIAQKIALAVAQEAINEGFATIAKDIDLPQILKHQTWQPQYLPYKETANANNK